MTAKATRMAKTSTIAKPAMAAKTATIAKIATAGIAAKTASMAKTASIVPSTMTRNAMASIATIADFVCISSHQIFAESLRRLLHGQCRYREAQCSRWRPL